MSSMQLQVIYDGEGLNNNEIDIKELSKALLGLNELFEEANSIINDGKAKVTVKVKGSFKTGCFKIDFNAYQSLTDIAVGIFTSPATSAVLNASGIFALIFRGPESVCGILKFLKGREEHTIFQNPDKTFKITKRDKFITVEENVYKLFSNYKLRKSFEDLVSPIEIEGIEDFAIKSENDKDFIHIKKDEIEYFKAIPSNEQKLDEPTIFDTNVTIINLAFKEGSKWYINDGDTSYYAQVEDQQFLNKIDNYEVQFGKGDILKVRIRKVQYYNSDEEKIKNKNYIEEVIKHIKPLQAQKLI